jgi:hypothetical protein
VVPSVSSPVARPAASLPPDLAAVKQSLELVRQRRPSEATALVMSISSLALASAMNARGSTEVIVASIALSAGSVRSEIGG